MHCYPPVGEKPGKRAQVEAMFNAVAPRYDLLNRVLSLGLDRRWRRTAVRALHGGHAQRILDVATGTGDMAFETHRIWSSEVVGMDISEEMLSIARRKAATKGVSGRVSFELGDVEDIPYAGGVFDAALVAFGVRNFQDLDRGLAELYRVLQKGGQLIILELTLPAGRFARLGLKLPPFSARVSTWTQVFSEVSSGWFVAQPDGVRLYGRGRVVW